MKILAVSDTHGDTEALYSIISANPDAELIIHLGDGEHELSDMRSVFYDKAFIGVKGNCDYSDLPQYSVPELCGYRFYLCHGHRFPQEQLYDMLYCTGAANGCAAVLFGHTHVPHLEERNGVLLFNPGSPSRPRGGSLPSYGIIELYEGKPVAARHITMKG